MIKNLRQRITAVEMFCTVANRNLHIRTPGLCFNDEPHQKRFWEELKGLDKEAGPDLAPGRVLSFYVADGSALYIVTKVGKQICQVSHVPYIDGYTSDAVCDGRVFTETARNHML